MINWNQPIMRIWCYNSIEIIKDFSALLLLFNFDVCVESYSPSKCLFFLSHIGVCVWERLSRVSEVSREAEHSETVDFHFFSFFPFWEFFVVGKRMMILQFSIFGRSIFGMEGHFPVEGSRVCLLLRIFRRNCGWLNTSSYEAKLNTLVGIVDD